MTTRMSPRKKKSSRNHFGFRPIKNTSTFSYHIVGYFDLLGQSNALAKITGLPNSPEERVNFTKEIKNTLGKIYSVRELLNQFFANYVKASSSIKSYSSMLSENDSRAFRELNKQKLGFQGFSDTLLIYAPLVLPNGYYQVGTITAMIMATSAMMLSCLGMKIPVRGALEIGIGAEPFENEFYGPCLLSVYELERAADWPRVIVGDQMIRFLSEIASDRSDKLRDIYSMLAMDCSHLMCKDLDNKVIVNYLSPSVLIHTPSLDGQIPHIKKQIVEMKESHGDLKISNKYLKVLEYFQNHGR